MRGGAASPRDGRRAELLDGLSEWMSRKGFATLDELRGMLAVSGAEDETDFERAGYVDALRDANCNAYGPW